MNWTFVCYLWIVAYCTEVWICACIDRRTRKKKKENTKTKCAHSSTLKHRVSIQLLYNLSICLFCIRHTVNIDIERVKDRFQNRMMEHRVSEDNIFDYHFDCRRTLWSAFRKFCKALRVFVPFAFLCMDLFEFFGMIMHFPSSIVHGSLSIVKSLYCSCSYFWPLIIIFRNDFSVWICHCDCSLIAIAYMTYFVVVFDSSNDRSCFKLTFIEIAQNINSLRYSYCIR